MRASTNTQMSTPKNEENYKSEHHQSLELCSHLLLEVETAGQAANMTALCHLNYHTWAVIIEKLH